MRNKDYSQYLTMSPKELRELQNRRGCAMSAVGYIVYAVLKLFGQKSKDYEGICPYFEIGTGWGGVSLGWFFICSKDCPTKSRNHEVGHCIQNAAVGGLIMVAYSVGSFVRYWCRKLFGSKTPYDSWYFEGDATRIGNEYVARLNRSKRNKDN